MKITQTVEQVSQGKQSRTYLAYYVCENNLALKVDIKVDPSYDFQSHCVLYVMSAQTMDWKPLVSRPFTEMKSVQEYKSIPTTQKTHPSDFAQDVTWLLAEGSKLLECILGGKE